LRQLVRGDTNQGGGHKATVEYDHYLDGNERFLSRFGPYKEDSKSILYSPDRTSSRYFGRSGVKFFVSWGNVRISIYVEHHKVNSKTIDYARTLRNEMFYYIRPEKQEL
jgi:hypothetical protein